MGLDDLLLTLRAAAALAPILETVLPTIQGATAAENPLPVSAAQSKVIFSALEQAAAVAPALVALIPLVKQAFDGTEFNDADLATLRTSADAIDKAVEAKVAAIEAEMPAEKPAPVVADKPSPELPQHVVQDPAEIEGPAKPAA